MMELHLAASDRAKKNMQVSGFLWVPDIQTFARVGNIAS